MAKSKCPSSIWQRKGPGTKSISVIAIVAWYKINFIGLQLYRNESELIPIRDLYLFIFVQFSEKSSLPARIAGADRIRCSTNTGVCSDIGNTKTSIHPVSYGPIWDETVLIPDLNIVRKPHRRQPADHFERLDHLARRRLAEEAPGRTAPKLRGAHARNSAQGVLM